MCHRLQWLVVSTDCPVSQGQGELGLDIVGHSTLNLVWKASIFPLLLFIFSSLYLPTFSKQEAKRGKWAFMMNVLFVIRGMPLITLNQWA